MRRLASWFNDKFFTEVSNPLVTERFYKRRMPVGQGGGPLLEDRLLPPPERQAFLASYQTHLCEQHGKVLEEYVEVPNSLLRNVDELERHRGCRHRGVDRVAARLQHAQARRGCQRLARRNRAVARHDDRARGPSIPCWPVSRWLLHQDACC